MSNGDLYSMELRAKFASINPKINTTNKNEILLQNQTNENNNINKYNKTQQRYILYTAITVIYRKLIKLIQLNKHNRAI